MASVYFTVAMSGDRELDIWLSRFGPAINQALRTIMGKAMKVVEREVIQRTPVGWTRKLSTSYYNTISTGSGSIIGTFKSSDNPAKVASVEYGRRAGAPAPPMSALAPWAAFKLGTTDPHKVFMLGQSIAANGIPGRFMFRDGFEAAKPEILSLFRGVFSEL